MKAATISDLSLSVAVRCAPTPPPESPRSSAVVGAQPPVVRLLPFVRSDPPPPLILLSSSSSLRSEHLRPPPTSFDRVCPVATVVVLSSSTFDPLRSVHHTQADQVDRSEPSSLSIRPVREVKLEFWGFTASVVGANSPLFGCIRLDVELNKDISYSSMMFEQLCVVCAYDRAVLLMEYGL
ncbi:hypothetical protein E6C27_scaffold219G001740 [Cucumis melo var. makuwa]|uniref:Ty3-gypsy retrotransposon protein n=1 Tax=Cucumis melo var. makuwa TaxID=1194695 RepID=A0A5A7SSD7_CUCMM|nr:hypothetical protein E6C27_scaffold219G001740 [Cucumis melo var. makuwa]